MAYKQDERKTCKITNDNHRLISVLASMRGVSKETLINEIMSDYLEREKKVNPALSKV